MIKKLLLALIFVMGGLTYAHSIEVDGFASNACTINTSSALTAHATDCTGTTAVADVYCYERDSNRIFVCEPSAGDCDTAGEWKLLDYVALTGSTMTGTLNLDDTSLTIEEGADTMTITVPVLTAARAVTFSDAAGAVILNSSIDTLSELDTIVADEALVVDSDLDTFAEVQTLVADETLVKAGTLTDTKACVYDLAGTDIVCNSDFLPLGGGTMTGDIGLTAQDLDVADSGDGTAATATLNPTSNVVIVSCADSDGCDITMGESDTVVRVVSIVNDTANAANFADTAGVSEIAGAFAMGDNDSLTLVYNGSEWVEVSRSNN